MNDQIQFILYSNIIKLKNHNNHPHRFSLSTRDISEWIYSGKSSREQILTQPLRADLKVVKMFGSPHKWQNMLIFGDNLEILKYFLNQNSIELLKNPDGSQGVRLIYIDPPFGTGDTYDRNHVSVYSAKRTGVNYIEWLRKRIILLRELLTDNGSFYLRTDYRYGHYMRLILDEIFGKENFRNEIVINRTRKIFDGIRRFNTATDKLLFYTKTENYIFHGLKKYRAHQQWIPMHSPGIRWTKVDKDYISFYSEDQLIAKKGYICSRGRVFDGKLFLPPEGRHWTFTQKRMEHYHKEGRIRLNQKTGILEYLTSSQEIVDSNWTDIPGYTFKWGYPTENSEQLLERIISASSNPGDIVMDVFAGSGTTGAVAEKLGRRWVMADSSKLSIYIILKRMLNLKREIGNRGKKLYPAPFSISEIILKSGRITPIFRLKSYQNLALSLFQCVEKRNKFGEVSTVGNLNGHPVILFPEQGKSLSKLSKEFLERIHTYLRSENVKKVYIITPQSIVDVIPDSLLLDKIEYQILKIPNSIVELLSKKDNELENKRILVLDHIIQNTAFDFIYPPTVKSKINIRKSSKGTEGILKIIDFQTNTPTKKPLPTKKLGFHSLAMVSVDPQFNGKYIRPQYTYWGKDLVKWDYQCCFPILNRKNLLLITYTDIFGNEKRELRSIKNCPIVYGQE